VDRRAKIAAAERAAGLLKQIMELEERVGRRWTAVAKRHAALMREFDRHAQIVESLPLPTENEVKAAMAVMRAATRLIDRFEIDRARVGGREAKLLEELRPLWRLIEARERARLAANFCFWLRKNEREKLDGHTTDGGNGKGSGDPQSTSGVGITEAKDGKQTG